MQKQFIFIGMTVGSIIGGYLPVLFKVSAFSTISILTSTIGGLLGIYLGYLYSKNL